MTGSHGSDGCLVSALKRRRSSLFFSPYTASFHPFFLTLSQKSLLASLWNPLSITLNPHSSLPLSKITLNPHSLKSQSLSCLYLCPSSLSHCRNSAQISSSLSRLCLSPLLLSQCSPDRSSLSHAHLWPNCNLAQVLYLWYYQYQRFRLAVNTFSLLLTFCCCTIKDSGGESEEVDDCGAHDLPFMPSYILILSNLYFSFVVLESFFFFNFFFLGINFEKFLCVAMSFAYLGCYFVFCYLWFACFGYY